MHQTPLGGAVVPLGVGGHFGLALGAEHDRLPDGVRTRDARPARGERGGGENRGEECDEDEPDPQALKATRGCLWIHSGGTLDPIRADLGPSYAAARDRM